ncbi:MAG TPA: T9SS type A sorting domain-containing protein [Saprospiraceae bacterium]|nr:T9SS type A sorting domain-containing protein [Saprospiraceae bacterium]
MKNNFIANQFEEAIGNLSLPYAENKAKTKFDLFKGVVLNKLLLFGIFFILGGHSVFAQPATPVGFVANPGGGSGQVFLACGPNGVGMNNLVYRLFYSPTATAPANPLTATQYTFGSTAGDGGGTAAFGFNISGLTPSTGYTFWLYQYNTATMEYSAAASATQTSGGSIPGTPVGFVANPAGGSGQVFLACGPNGVGMNNLVYRLFYSPTATAPANPLTATQYTFGSTGGDGGGTAAFGFNISGLTPSTGYTFWLYQYNTATMVYSAAASATQTSGGAPAGPTAPATAAPAPTCGQANVISVYSDTYTNNIPGTNFNPNWNQSGFGSATTITIGGNEMRYYPNMNYQGIALGSNQNVSSFQSLRLDIWSANCSSIDIYLVTAANGERAVRRSLTLNSWNSIEIQLADYSSQGIPLTAIKEFKFVTITPASGANIYVDNIHFVNSSCATAPTTVNTTFCVDYTCVANSTGFAAQQINFDGGTFNGFRNLTRMGTTNIWCGTFAIPAGETVRYSFFYAAAAGAGGFENLTGLTCANNGRRTYTAVAGSPETLTFAWESCSSTPVCPPPPAPTVTAPVPTCAQANVASVYSDTYTNIAGTNFNPNWGQAGFAGATTVTLSGNQMRYYPNMNYQGIALGVHQRIDSFQTLRLDIWSANCSSIDIYLVATTGVERAVRRSLTLNSWNSINIPLADYVALGMSSSALIKEFKFVAITPPNGANIYVDNIYFAKVNCTDVTPPMLNCTNITVTFNGQNSIPLTASQLATATDDFGTPILSINPTVITCQQVGQSVPVTVTARDATGNTATCISTVTVAGLPCGWSQQPNGVNCANGNSIAFNAATGVYTATSTGCSYGPPFSSDATAFAQRTLCGNGSITARVTGINPLAGGWAGIVMREGNAAGAKKAQLMTNLGSDHRREFRTTTNGAAQPQQFPSLSRYWLRITRVGNQFTMFVSSNGTNWFPAGSQNIAMSNCIEMGLVATNNTSNSTVTATFSNVSFSGSTSGLGTGGGSMEQSAHSIEAPHSFEVYPNPTGGELNLDLTQYIGRSVRIEMYSLEGKLLQFSELDEVQTTLKSLDLSRFQNGMYLVKVKSAGLPDAVRRVVKQ